MKHYLDNPVYNALSSGDAHMACGAGTAKYFNEDVSPFAGFPEYHTEGFDELHSMLPPSRKILYASRKLISEPAGWELTHLIQGLQFVHTGNHKSIQPSINLVPLTNEHVDEMIDLARLTKPGPFDKRTIEFGHFHGVFNNNKLVSMTGQRLHVYEYSEVSAVCTHPDYLGKGFAEALIQQQLNIICESGKIPFLHVRNDNDRAIKLYERLGFSPNCVMNFYFLKRK